MGDVIEINFPTKLDLPPDKVLECAIGKLNTVIIIGYDENMEEYFASSTARMPDILWLLEKMKNMMLAQNGD